MSGRRKALLATVLAALALMAAARWLGVAGFSGTQLRDMDWDSDGTVTRGEILRGYSTIAVRDTVEGRRSCRSYARLGDSANPLRVDCRVEFAPSAP